jgi:hypothetical protein
MSNSKVKTMLICFFDTGGIINFEFVPERTNICFFDTGGIINFESVPERTNVIHKLYVVLKGLIDAMRQKQGELWRDHSLILHQDNELAHSLIRLSQFLAGKGIFAMDHPLYSPALAPADLWLFTEINRVRQGKVFLKC